MSIAFNLCIFLNVKQILKQIKPKRGVKMIKEDRAEFLKSWISPTEDTENISTNIVDSLINRHNLGAKFQIYPVTFKGAEMLVSSKVKDRDVIYQLRILEKSWSQIENIAFDACSDMASKIMKLKVTESDFEKYMLFDFIQIEPTVIILGFNATRSIKYLDGKTFVLQINNLMRGAKIYANIIDWKFD